MVGDGVLAGALPVAITGVFQHLFGDGDSGLDHLFEQPVAFLLAEHPPDAGADADSRRQCGGDKLTYLGIHGEPLR